MKLSVRVIPRSSREFIKEELGVIKAYVTKPPEDGLANEAVIKLLSGHFNVAKSRIKIARGQKSRNKIVEIDG